MEDNNHLLIAGCLSFVAAILHVAIIIGGPDWYRFFGAGEAMAQMAEAGSLRPTIITLCIAAMLSVWGLYAFSGAGLISKLPLLKLALVLITAVYLVRGIAGLILPFVSSHPAITQNSLTFWMVSSVICCVFGLFHLFGTLAKWQHL